MHLTASQIRHRANTMMSKMDQSRIKGTYLDYVNHMAKLDRLVMERTCVIRFSN